MTVLDTSDNSKFFVRLLGRQSKVFFSLFPFSPFLFEFAVSGRATRIAKTVLRDLMKHLDHGCPCARDAAALPSEFLEQLPWMQAALKTEELSAPLTRLVAVEETIYPAKLEHNYFAD